jgi:hypothetical protein
VLAYGGNEALREIRERVPVTTRFLGYGHKLGWRWSAAPRWTPQRGPATARLAALDVARYEQQGCYSPHAVYVERGGAMAPREFALHLAAELSNLEQRHPRRALSLAESADAAGLAAGGRVARAAGQGSELFGDEQGPGRSPSASDRAALRAFGRSPLRAGQRGRCAGRRVPLVEPHAAFLQTIGPGQRSAELYRLAELFGQAGATRIAPLGAMTQPEAGWHHDGRFNLPTWCASSRSSRPPSARPTGWLRTRRRTSP